MAEISELIVGIKADIEKFNTGMNSVVKKAEDSMGRVFTVVDQNMAKSQKRMDEFVTHAGESGKQAGNAFGSGMMLALAAVSTEFLIKIESSIEKIATLASTLDTLKIVTGNSVEQLQKFTYAMARVGVDSGQAQMQLTQFQQRIEVASQRAKDTSSVFYKLGLSAKEMVGKDAISNFELAATKISQLKDATAQTTAASELFGRRLGTRLLPILAQGKVGIEELMGAAAGMGAVIPQDLITKFGELDGALKSFSQTVLAFTARMVGPLIPALTRMVDAFSTFLGKIENLGPMNQMLIMLGALSVAFIAFEKGIELVSASFIGSFIKREAIDVLLDFAGILRVILLVLTALTAAWVTDFAGIREAAYPVIQALKIGMTDFHKTLDDVHKMLVAKLGPAFKNLGDAIHPLLVQFGDLLIKVIGTKDALKLFSNIVSTMADGLKAVVDAVTEVVKLLGDLKTALEIIVVIWLPALITLIGKGLVNALILAVDWVTSLGIAGDIASGGMLLILQAIVIVIILIASHWRIVAQAFLDFGATIVDVLSKIVDWYAKMYKWLADIIEKIPGMNNVATAIREWGNAATFVVEKLKAVRDWLLKVEEAAKAPPSPGSDTTEADSRNRESDSAKNYKPPDAKPPGDATYRPAETKSKDKSGEVNREALDAIKRPVDDAKFALLKAQVEVKNLEGRLNELGTINSPQTLKKSQELYTQKIAASNKEIEAQIKLMSVVEVAAQRAEALARSQKPGALRRTDEAAARAYRTEALNHEEQKSAMIVARNKAQNDLLQKEIDFQKTIASNSSSTWAAQEAAQNRIIVLMERQKGITDAQKDAELVRLTSIKDAQFIQNHRDVSGSDNAAIDANRRLTNATPITNDPTGSQQHLRDLSLAADTVQKSLNTLSVTQIAADKALAAFQQTAEKIGSPAYAVLLNASYDAEAKRTIAVIDNKIATIEFTAVQHTAAKAAFDVNSALLNLLEGAIGPFGKVLQAFVTGGPIAGLTTLFTSLFEKTKSFHDITVIMTRIFDALAQVLDALRPVIDILLGVLVGVVNVFLTLGNILISILNLFGLHQAKLRLVNTSLDDLSKGANTARHSLIEIVHDLPTMNEYNKGKWADLAAKQQATANAAQTGNDILDKGFNQSLSKFGQMIGWLIAIHIAMKLMTAAQFAFGSGSGGGGLAGFISKIADLFTHHASATAASIDTTDAITRPLSTKLDAIDATGQAGVAATKENAASTSQALSSSSKFAALAQRGAQAAGSAFAIYDGFKKGGVGGGVEAGMGAQSLSMLLLSHGAFGLAAGPLGVGIGVAVGLAAMFTHHDDPNKMPDKYNTQEYGSGVANLMGYAGANGQNFTEDAQTKQQLGGKDELDYINAHIDELMKINPALAAEFKGASGVSSLHDGVLGLNNGTQKRWNDLLNDANTAVTSLFHTISTSATAAAQDLQSILKGAPDANLAAMFGNGQVVSVGGGYSVTPGNNFGNGTSGTGGNTTNSGVNVSVNIGNLNGGDPAQLTATLTPIMRQSAEDYARIAQQQVSNNRFLSRQENI